MTKRQKANLEQYGRTKKAIDWAGVKEAFILGMPIKEIAKLFNCSYKTIENRSYAEDWPSPEKVMKLVEGDARLVEQAKNRELTKNMALSIADKADAYQQVIFDQVSKLITKKVKKPKFLEVKDWKDLDTADKIARRAAGLDNGEGTKVATIVNLNGMIEAPDPVPIPV
jgi:hypothetical protein